ncbi:MAG: cyclic nucleotide-binding domain-containing protein, partial [Actinobacteria bacterium]|nr:cyclic nucleotide-binding domain-containing protein [Actinomycetota bacterium]
MNTHDILRGITYFSDLPEKLLLEVCNSSEQVELEPGTVIIEEGASSEEMYVLVEGELVVTTSQQGREVELARINPGEVVGELALLDKAPRIASVAAAKPSLVIKVPATTFDRLLDDPRVARRMFRTITARLRSTEETLRHGERMAALGRMAAQLMHELNNPAAAIGRSSQALAEVQRDLTEVAQELYMSLGEGVVTPDPVAPPTSAFDRARAEEEMAEWMTERDVPDAYDLAAALVAGGWTTEGLAGMMENVDERWASLLIRAIGLRTAAGQLSSEIEIAARRISELVRIVKEYSFLDQAPVQDVDVVKGIADTLILLKHKVRNIEVVTEFDPDLAQVPASGRDLNQVWTNLIDNASDVMRDGGTLRITAKNKGDDVVVTVSDTGGG